MTDKILGKYKILKEESSSLKIVQYNDCDYRIEIVSKTPQSGQYSEIAKNINSVSHKNISNLKIEEDNSNFYFVEFTICHSCKCTIFFPLASSTKDTNLTIFVFFQIVHINYYIFIEVQFSDFCCGFAYV